VGVLMPETREGTQGLPKKPAPVSIPPVLFFHEGRRGSLGDLMPFFPHPLPALPRVQGRTENMCDAHFRQHQNAMVGRFGTRPYQCSA
jgi:hypothetical protein